MELSSSYALNGALVQIRLPSPQQEFIQHSDLSEQELQRVYVTERGTSSSSSSALRVSGRPLQRADLPGALMSAETASSGARVRACRAR
ncbi:hypothetical protein SRHO_G00152390 [Serrasalmus rhombeus]